MSDAPQGPGWWQASDGRFYPPQAQPSAPAQVRQYAPPGPNVAPGAYPGSQGPGPAPWTPPEKKNGRGWAIALAVVFGTIVLTIGGCVAIVAIAGRGAVEFFDEIDALDDSNCEFVELDSGQIAADITVRNTTDARSDYRFRVIDPTDNNNDNFLNGFDFDIDGVDVGQTVTERTGPFPIVDLTENQMGSCRLARASRSASL